MEYPCVNSVATYILTCKMSSSMFPQDFNRPFLGHDFHLSTLQILLPFHFEAILIQFLYVVDFRSISGLLLVLHWQTSKSLNKSMLTLSDLELPALPYIAPITAISGCQNINYIMHMKLCGDLVEGDLSLLKVCEGPLGYAEWKPFDFTLSFYTAL